MDMDGIYRNLEEAERALNICGWIPVVSLLTGNLRVTAGAVEAAAGAAISVAAAAGRDRELCGHGLNLLFHGGMNIVRGNVEMCPIGHFLCFCYDLSGARYEYERHPWRNVRILNF